MKSTNAFAVSVFSDSLNTTRWLPPAKAVSSPLGPAGASAVPIFFSSSGLVWMIELYVQPPATSIAMSPLMNASWASGSSQPIEAFGRQVLLVERRVEVDRLDALGRVERGLPGVAVLGGDLAARLPDRRQVVVLGQAVERDRVDAAALLLDRLRGRLELVPRLRDLDAGLLEHVLAVDQRARAGVPRLAPDLVVERRGVDQRRDVVARRGRGRRPRTRPGRRTRASTSCPSRRRRAPCRPRSPS